MENVKRGERFSSLCVLCTAYVHFGEMDEESVSQLSWFMTDDVGKIAFDDELVNP